MKLVTAIVSLSLLVVLAHGQTIPDEPQPIPNSYDGTTFNPPTYISYWISSKCQFSQSSPRQCRRLALKFLNFPFNDAQDIWRDLPMLKLSWKRSSTSWYVIFFKNLKPNRTAEHNLADREKHLPLLWVFPRLLAYCRQFYFSQKYRNFYFLFFSSVPIVLQRGLCWNRFWPPTRNSSWLSFSTCSLYPTIEPPFWLPKPPWWSSRKIPPISGPGTRDSTHRPGPSISCENLTRMKILQWNV